MTLGRRNFREIYAPSRRNLKEINKRNLRLFRKKSSPEPTAAPPAPLRPLSVRAAPLTTPRRSYATTTHERPLWMASQAR